MSPDRSHYRNQWAFRVVVLFLVVIGFGLACSRSPSESCAGPFAVGGDVSAPLKIHGPQPSYTEEARVARIQGAVVVRATVTCEGLVSNTVVVKGLPLGLSEATVEAVRQWRFEPAMLNGESVSVFYDVTVNFRIQ